MHEWGLSGTNLPSVFAQEPEEFIEEEGKDETQESAKRGQKGKDNKKHKSYDDAP
jgi:hypothetical protein